MDDAAMELSTVPTFTGDVMAAAASLSAGHVLAYLLDARQHCAVTPAWSSLTREGICHETRTDPG
jgi:hypothetical protein